MRYFGHLRTIILLLIAITTTTLTTSVTSTSFLARHYDRNTNISSIIPRWKGLSLLSWALLFVVVFASSFIGAFIDGGLSAATNQVLDPNVVPGEPNWYANLNRPWWEPPGWVFPIMWLIVSKPTQLVALSRLLKTTNDDKQSLIGVVLGVYSAHLSLGDAWNKVFFGYQCIGRGVVVITLFFGVLLASAVLFGRVDEGAGRWLVPTCGWVAIATCLNWSIYFRNKK